MNIKVDQLQQMQQVGQRNSVSSGDGSFKFTLISNIEKIAGNYIYIPYSCLNFCYGDTKEPDESKAIAYDRAATEVA